MAASYTRDLAMSFVSQTPPVYVFQTGAVANVGEKIVGFMSCVEDVTLTMTDSAGNTYGVNKTRDGSTLASLFLVYSDVTTQLPAAGTMTYTFSGIISGLNLTFDALSGAATGTPADFQASAPGQIANWSTPNSTTSDGSLIYGGSVYRVTTTTTSTPDTVTPPITERHDGNRASTYNMTTVTRDIATGGSHNISGVWLDATGSFSTAKHMLIASAPAGSPPNFPVAARVRYNG